MLNYDNFFDQSLNEILIIKKYISKYGHLVDIHLSMKFWAENTVILQDNTLSIVTLENIKTSYFGGTLPCKLENNTGFLKSSYNGDLPFHAYAHFLSFIELNNRFLLSVPNLKQNLELLLIGKV